MENTKLHHRVTNHLYAGLENATPSGSHFPPNSVPIQPSILRGIIHCPFDDGQKTTTNLRKDNITVPSIGRIALVIWAPGKVFQGPTIGKTRIRLKEVDDRSDGVEDQERLIQKVEEPKFN